MEARSVTVYAGPVERGNRRRAGLRPESRNSDVYLPRADPGDVVPGKWVQGNCNVPYGGSEQIMRSYEVAYGSARWRPYQGGVYGLAQTGSNADGSPLYSCRVRYSPNPGTDYGYQPGKLVSDGTCHIPMGGGEVVQGPPFDVLYGTGGGRPPYPYPPNPYPPYPYPNPYPMPPVHRRNHIHRAGKAIRW